jgi:hypothetical protein
MLKVQSKIYSISDFWQWYERGELILSPIFQRREVWSEKAKSYLLDTIIRGKPIPKIFMRNIIDISTKKTKIEIVDGQQRLRAILSYLEDGFRILKVHNDLFGGMYYSDLPDDIKRNILEFDISSDILTGASTADILDIFARINTYTVTLNRQELLNSKYFGAFKKTVYGLGYEYVDYWIKNGVLTKKQATRMLEAELASELFIQLIDGIQDRKVLENYYKKYDDELPNKSYLEKEFKNNIDQIADIIKNDIINSNFRNRPLYYSLFGVINELRNDGLIKKSTISKINSVLYNLDSILDSDPADIRPSYYKFYDASTKHVTDLSARKIRHKLLKQFIVKELK